MASSGVPALLPPVKSVMVYKNGDPFFSGRRFIVNQRQVATMESFLNDVTLSIGAPLAVRTLYTPRHGHRVADLEHLQQGAQYVAAGFERFKKLDYLSLGTKRAPVARTDFMQDSELNPSEPSAVCTFGAKGLSKPNVSAKWRKVVTLPCILHVFRNGDVLSPAMRFLIPRSLLKNLEQILSLVSEKAMLRTGAVRRLCTLDGVTVNSAEELESSQCYVAVGAERFKKLPYVEMLLNKAPAGSADRYYAADRGLHRRLQNRKFPHDSNSDSALFHSPERDGRRVKSTGDEAELDGTNLSPMKRREGGGERDERSKFYAKPVRVFKHRSPHRAALRNPGESSVFKGIERRREEVRGAEEVAEDESTAVELPVDQRDAEVVQEEDLEPRQTETDHMPQTDAVDEHMTSSHRFSPSPSNREQTVKEYDPFDGETSLSRRSPSLNGKVAAAEEEEDEDLLSDDLEQRRDQEEKEEGLDNSKEAETLDHTGSPSSSSQQRE